MLTRIVIPFLLVFSTVLPKVTAQIGDRPQYETPEMLQSGTEILWWRQIRDTSNIDYIEPPIYTTSRMRIFSKPISHIADNNDIIMVYSNGQNGFQAIRYEAATGDTVWHTMVNRSNTPQGIGHTVVGLDATENDLLLAINREDPDWPPNAIGLGTGIFGTMTIDNHTGTIIASNDSDSIRNYSSHSGSLIYHPIDRLTGKYVSARSRLDPIRFDTVNNVFIIEPDTLTTTAYWRSIDPPGNYYDPPVDDNDTYRWRSLDDSLWRDHTSSSPPIKSKDGRAMLKVLITPDDGFYRVYLEDYNYDEGSLTPHDRTTSWGLYDSIRIHKMIHHPDGYLINTSYFLAFNDPAEGYMIIDDDFNLMEKKLPILFDGYHISHMETLCFPDGDRRLLHICRRRNQSDIFYYVEQPDGSYHLAGQLHNPNRPIYAFLPKHHSWDHEGNLIGHFNVLLDSITVGSERFQSGRWLFLYKMDKDALQLEPTSTTDITHQEEVLLFANPGRDMFEIRTDATYDQVVLYDNTGKQVYSNGSPLTRISSAGLPPGVYHVQLLRDHIPVASQTWIKVH